MDALTQQRDERVSGSAGAVFGDPCKMVFIPGGTFRMGDLAPWTRRIHHRPESDAHRLTCSTANMSSGGFAGI